MLEPGMFAWVVLSLSVLRVANALTAAQDLAVATCCSMLENQLPNLTFSRDRVINSTYQKESTAFWSATEWLDPACVFMPQTTGQVSQAVTIFNRFDCPFAIRGGGHHAIRGAANIDDGILMSMRHVNDITFNTDKSIVTVGAGNTFAQIYEEVEKHGRIIVGGRFGTVGTGLLLGAGLSYFNNRHGLACDNVAGYRTVLGNGTVVNARADTNPDLHWALKGGGNNFGVVTHFELYTIVSQGVYGGRVVYSPSATHDLIGATYKYHTETAMTELDAHVLPSFVFDNTINQTYGFLPVVQIGNTTQLSDGMRYWTDMNITENQIKHRTFGDLATSLVAGFPDGLVQAHYSFTTYPDQAWFAKVLERWTDFGMSKASVSGYTGLLAIMPITPRAVAEGVRKGGNALGLNRGKANTTLSVFYIGVTFNSLQDSEAVLPDFDTFIRGLEAEAKRDSLLYPYIMTTYSGASQGVLTSYGLDTLNRMATVQQRYDPTLVFQRLVTGGQKLPLRVTY